MLKILKKDILNLGTWTCKRFNQQRRNRTMNDPYNVHTSDKSTTIIVISRTTEANLQEHMDASSSCLRFPASTPFPCNFFCSFHFLRIAKKEKRNEENEINRFNNLFRLKQVQIPERGWISSPEDHDTISESLLSF